MITPDDLRNPNRASGYNYVSNAQSRGGKRELWCAKKGRFERGSAATDWHGPCRRDPRQAAQDFCDYVNGNRIQLPTRLTTAGHKGQRPQLPQDPEVKHALGVLRDARAQSQGKQGYVYLIVEEHPGGALKFAKVGYSTNPRARVAELQTGNPRPLRLHMMKPGTIEDEAAIHQKFIRENVLQEWFRITPELLFEWDAEHYVEEDAA